MRCLWIERALYLLKKVVSRSENQEKAANKISSKQCSARSFVRSLFIVLYASVEYFAVKFSGYGDIAFNPIFKAAVYAQARAHTETQAH